MTDTKPSPWMDYAERIRRVQVFIHQHLDEDLDLNRLAEVACLSPYHWHRIYQGITGETASATVKRLRLHRAAGWLAYGQHSIADIAGRSGYSSVEAFTRAFKAAYTMPPAEYRARGGHVQFTNATKQGEPNMFEVTIRQLPPRQAVTLEHKGSYQKIGQAFETLGTWAAVNGILGPSSRMIGLYYCDPAVTAEADLRSKAGITVETPPASLPAPYELTQMQGGEYAVLRLKGPYAELPAAYQWLYSTWLPQSGRQVADAPPMEDYLNTPRDAAPQDLLTDICIPLR